MISILFNRIVRKEEAQSCAKRLLCGPMRFLFAAFAINALELNQEANDYLTQCSSTLGNIRFNIVRPIVFRCRIHAAFEV